MNAIYKGQLYNLGDNLNVVELTDPETGVNMTVPWGDPELIVDPTDDQVFNLVPDDRTGGLIRLKRVPEQSSDNMSPEAHYEYTPKEKEAAGIIDLLSPLIVADGHYVGPELFKRLTLRLSELI